MCNMCVICAFQDIKCLLSYVQKKQVPCKAHEECQNKHYKSTSRTKIEQKIVQKEIAQKNFGYSN